MAYRKCFYTGIILSLLLVVTGLKAQKPADRITGTWVTSNKDGRVRITQRENGKYYGKLVWTKNKRGDDSLDRDIHNPDPDKRDRTVRGITLLKGLTYNAEEALWEGGKIYDPNKGKTYKCYVEILNPDKLKVRGYVGFSMMGRSTYWQRYQP